MKLKNIIPFVLVALILGLNSCYDEKMEWADPYNHPAAKDLPLGLQEKISRYEALTAYTTFKLGVGIDFSLYMSDATYRNLVNQNFKEVTPGNEMKQSSILNARGEWNFTNVDNVLAQLKSAGLTVYGHTLVWHSQQQASYINSLLLPTIIPGSPGSSLIANGDFETGLDGWDIPFYQEAVTQSADYSVDGTHSMKVAVGDWGTGKYNMQINSPKFQIINGHKYEISFFIKSDGEGKVGVDFPNNNLTNQYPWTNGTELVTTSSAWTKVTYSPTTTPDGMVATADNNAMTFRLLLGAVKNMTYYIDAVEVIDLDAAPVVVNMVSNGDFENGTLDPWSGWGNSSTRTLSADGEGYGGGHAMILNNPKNAQSYEAQAAYTFDNPLKQGTRYKATAMIKSSVGNGSIQMEVQNASYGGQYSGDVAVGLSWQELNWEFEASTDDRIRFLFDFGKIAGDYYVDKIVFAEVPNTPAASPALRATTGGPTEIPQTPEEKAHKVDSVLQAWIKGMTTHFKGNVAAWDVVNEPMNENGTLRTGIEDLSATSVFYWQYYLGKDYAVKAFKYAKEGDSNAKLFINDYNLESASGAKLNGLIDYVQYIESQGAKVDGIGTQLHLNINWSDTTAIEKMFQKLAATGKLIKVSELDIKISSEESPSSPVSPTAEDYAKQADLYRFVAQAYTKYIPEAQRYGITVWSISDNEKEHAYWLKNDAPCLWNADYARKHAYKGFADGLAGKDVSADFSGELVY